MTILILLLELPEKLPEKLMNKVLKEELRESHKKEDFLLMREKLLEKEKLDQESGSEQLTTILAKFMRRAKSKLLRIKNSNVKLYD